MPTKQKDKFKSGAASFYVVIFATLILMVVVISFAAVIASEMTKSSNDDLSQSAYDSALAGVEDAKLAYYSYQNCLTTNIDKTDKECNAIETAMQSKDCNMVQQILGRSNQEVIETNTGNNMQQEYTCVIINDELSDYRATLSSSDATKVVRVRLDNNVPAANIKKVKISWYINDGSSTNFTSSLKNGLVTFSPLASTPPVISLSLLQTTSEFTLSDFDVTKGDRTNRGTVYLVPYENNGTNSISKEEGFLKSNDKTKQNNPFSVKCTQDGEFLCSTTVELPEPVGGTRNSDTFTFVVSLPYSKPTTDFSLEFYCGDEGCGTSQTTDTFGDTTSSNSNLATTKGMQVEIDSTGRANDLYRRIGTRLSNSSGYTLSIFGPLELLGGDGSSTTGSGNFSFEKNMTITSEYNFQSEP